MNDLSLLRLQRNGFRCYLSRSSPSYNLVFCDWGYAHDSTMTPGYAHFVEHLLFSECVHESAKTSYNSMQFRSLRLEPLLDILFADNCRLHNLQYYQTLFARKFDNELKRLDLENAYRGGVTRNILDDTRMLSDNLGTSRAILGWCSGGSAQLARMVHSKIVGLHASQLILIAPYSLRRDPSTLRVLERTVGQLPRSVGSTISQAFANDRYATTAVSSFVCARSMRCRRPAIYFELSRDHIPIGDILSFQIYRSTEFRVLRITPSFFYIAYYLDASSSSRTKTIPSYKSMRALLLTSALSFSACPIDTLLDHYATILPFTQRDSDLVIGYAGARHVATIMLNVYRKRGGFTSDRILAQLPSSNYAYFLREIAFSLIRENISEQCIYLTLASRHFEFVVVGLHFTDDNDIRENYTNYSRHVVEILSLVYDVDFYRDCQIPGLVYFVTNSLDNARFVRASLLYFSREQSTRSLPIATLMVYRK